MFVYSLAAFGSTPANCTDMWKKEERSRKKRETNSEKVIPPATHSFRFNSPTEHKFHCTDDKRVYDVITSHACECVRVCYDLYQF